MTNYRRSVVEGVQDQSLNINSANIEWRYKAFEHIFVKRDQESQVIKANVSVPIQDDSAANKILSETDNDFHSSKLA